MLLEPKIPALTVESCVKDLGLARSAWDRALGLGLREQAITGNAWAQFAEGRRQFYREKNYVAAVEWTHKAADQGLAAAQYTLGVMYGSGWGVEKNYSLSVKWHRKAAEQGLAVSQSWLGISYGRGEGVERSHTFAVDWYRKAAVQGHSKAQYTLGRIYERGVLGVAKSNSLAVEWYRKAAIQGYDDAKDRLQKLLPGCYLVYQ
jgi:TPR repeat protein